MPQERHLSLHESTLARLDVQFLILQPSQHGAQMLQVLLLGAAEDEDVIQKAQHARIQHICERLIHQLHERTRCVAQAHRQHCVFEVPKASAECGLLAVLRLNGDLMKAVAQVDRREELRAMRAVEQLVHQRQRVLVLHGHLVERAIVNHHARRSVLLHHDQRHAAVRRRRWLQDTGTQPIVNVLLQHCCVLLALMAKRPRRWRNSARHHLDGMLHPSLARYARLGLTEHASLELLQQCVNARMVATWDVGVGERDDLRFFPCWSTDHCIQLLDLTLAHELAHTLLRDGFELQWGCLRRSTAVVLAARQRTNAVLVAAAIDAQLNGALAEPDEGVMLLQPSDTQDQMIRCQRCDDEGRREVHRRSVFLTCTGARCECIRQRHFPCRTHLTAVCQRNTAC